MHEAPEDWLITVARIVVLVKDIPDLNDVKIDASTRSPMVDGAKRRLNDLDKRALEAAIRIKETGGAEVVTVSAGDERTRILHPRGTRYGGGRRIPRQCP